MGLFSWFTHFSFSSTQDHLPRGSMTHNDPVSPTSMINQENAPTDLSPGQSDGMFFSTEVPGSQRTTVCLTLTTNQQHKHTKTQHN